jgi:hypothetical protein
MSRSDIFVPARAVTERKVNRMYDTNMTDGQIIEFARVTSVTTEVDGTMTFGPALDKTPDLTAAYSIVGTAAEEPQLVRNGVEALSIDGSTQDTAAGAALASVPSYAAYCEIYIEDENIRWVQDGTAPAAGNGEQEMAGTTVKLYGRDAILGFRALVIDNTGAIASTGVSKLSVTFWNMNPERAHLLGA